MAIAIPKPKATVEIIVTDKNGKVIKRHKQEANSWLKNYYAWQAILFKLGETQELVDQTGATYICGGGITYTWDEPVGCNIGIAIGTSNLAWDVTQYALGSKYEEAAVATITYDAVAKLVRFSTSITVSVDVTVWETGIILRGIYEQGGSQIFVLIERTVLTASVDVPAGASISVIYTLQWA